MYRHLPNKTDEFETDEDLGKVFSLINNFLDVIERHNFAIFILNGNKANYNLEKIYRCVNHYFRYNQGAILTNNAILPISLIDYLRINLIENVSFENIKRNFHTEYNKLKVGMDCYTF